MSPQRPHTEYLSRIQAISLTIELDDRPPKKITFQDYIAFILYDDGSAQRLALPSLAVPGSTSDFKIDNNQISLRFPSQSRADTKNSSNFWLVKPIWTASQLSKLGDLQATCGTCGNTVATGISKWRDLPSEHWAELMDFWHCHKPHSHDHADQFNPNYAVSRFVPTPGLGYCGNTYFLIDHHNFTPCDHISNEAVIDGVVKIWKWDLALISDNIKQTVPANVVVAAMLAELLDAHAVYTYLISDPEKSRSVLIWLFNADITFTSNAETDTAPKEGFKLFYSSDQAQYGNLRKMRPEIEEVELPSDALQFIIDHLQLSTLSLPTQLQKFGLWDVGFLVKGL